MPSIDFDTDDSIDIPVAGHATEIVEPVIEIDPTYNPFEEEKKTSPVSGSGFSSGGSRKESVDGWEQLYAGFEKNDRPQSFEVPYEEPIVPEPVQQTIPSSDGERQMSQQGRFFQLKNRFILTSVKSGLMLIDQKRAHERILFEQFMETVRQEKSTSQKTLFPEEMHFGGEDAVIIRDIMNDLNSFGLQIEEPETGKFMVYGLPGHLEGISGSAIMDGILADYKTGEINLGEKIREQISASMAKKAAIQYGKVLSQEEMTELFDRLFACSEPSYSPSGKLIMSIIGNDELEKLFG